MRIRVTGRQPLRGMYRPSGNSNAAVALIAASMLSEAPVTLRNVPDTISVGVMLEVGQQLGLLLDSPDIKDAEVRLHTPQLAGRGLRREQTEAIGGTLLFIAPILARRRHAHISIEYPASRIYPHLEALRDLGVTVRVDGGLIDLKADTWEQREIVLTQASVTATALVCMLAAALGHKTVILNAASEPHIVDLLVLLSQFGARCEGAGSNLLTIHGMGGRTIDTGGDVTISPDHIEIASAMAMAALSGGRLNIEGTRRRDLRLIARVYERLGLTLNVDEDAVFVPAHESFTISSREEDVDLSVESSPWPGFPSDLIAMATVLATQARGTVLIHEKLFSNRLLFVDKLNAMGAQIVLCDPHRALVIGPTPLQADYIDNPDVRTGLAMLGAALCAQGETVIDTAEAFDRTFDHVLDKLVALGAGIRRSET